MARPRSTSLRRRAGLAGALSLVVAAAGMSSAVGATELVPRTGIFSGDATIADKGDAGTIELTAKDRKFTRAKVRADATLLDADRSTAGCAMGRTLDSDGLTRSGSIASDGTFHLKFTRTEVSSTDGSSERETIRVEGRVRSVTEARVALHRTVDVKAADGSTVRHCSSKWAKSTVKHPDGLMWPFPSGPRNIDCSKRKCVALTFDDGPGSQTSTLLETLRKYKARATFFVVGEMVTARPKALKSIDNAGHEIASHSWSHPSLTSLSSSSIRRQMARTSDAIKEVTGDRPQLMRPPFGAIDARVRSLLGDIGYPVVLWSVDPLDWRDRNSTTVANRVLKQVEPGSIVLLHDIHRSTVAAVPRILNELDDRGYVFVTVTELYGHSLKDGRIYHSAER